MFFSRFLVFGWFEMWVRVWLRPGGALGLECPVRRPGLVDIYCTKSKDEKNEKTQSSFYHGFRHKAHFGQVKKINPVSELLLVYIRNTSKLRTSLL